MRPRDLFHWKTYAYNAVLPALRRLGPARADACLALAGRVAAAWPSRHRVMAAAVARLGSGHERLAPALSAGVLRFVARDYLLETDDDATALGRFDVTGADALDAALAAGRGAILVGGHFGGHLSAFHWLYRRGVALRAMVQRPRHVTRALSRFFDRDEADPQSAVFLRRGLGPADCVARLLRVRTAVRSGQAVYFAGDIPWSGPNTRAGRLLGQDHRFLAVWADLSALTRTPVLYVFCTHEPGGRYALRFEPIGVVPRGGEDAAVAHFLGRLEAAVAARPDDAVAHLLWPCYGPAAAPAKALQAGETDRIPRPTRRAAVAWKTA